MMALGRPRIHGDDQTRWRVAQHRRRATLKRAAVAPQVTCRQLGSHCTLYCADWHAVAALLPRAAAVVTDPPYQTRYDYTKPRRRPSQWESNYAGTDTPFDPTPWLKFPEVMLFGADHYWEHLPRGGSWCCWAKMPEQDPADFAPCEWIWLKKAGPPQYFPHLWRGGMRAGEENWRTLGGKLHPAQKPVALLTFLVEQTVAPVVIDPYMGSGTTLTACVRLGRPCIGIELDPTFFAVACDRLQQEIESHLL